MKVAMLGAGGMGAAMTRRLVAQGHGVRVWDRTPDKAEALRDAGATPVGDAAEAVRDTNVVVTMLRDGDAATEVAQRFLPAMPDKAVWVQASTVGPQAADRLRQLADDAGRRMLDAPVSGSTQPAENGSLTWLVSGPDDAVDDARAVLESLGSVRHVGSAQEGSRLKVAVNAWMTAATVAFAESLLVCDDLAVDRETFLSVLDGGPLGMPYLAQKAALIAKGEFPAGFPVELALKDVDLAIAGGATHVPTLDHVRDVLARAADSGHGRDDVAAVSVVVARTG